MLPRDRRSNARNFLAFIGDAKFRGVVIPRDVAGKPVAFGSKSKRFHRAKCFRGGSFQICAFAPNQNASLSRHEVHEASKLQRNRFKIGVDICMVVFERRENQFVRMIVQKFRATIEERSLVLVAFDDELFPAPESVTAIVEVGDHAAYEEIGPPSGNVKDPRKHGGGGRLSVRAGDDNRSMARDKIILE